VNLERLDDYHLDDVMDWAGLIFPRVRQEISRTDSAGDEITDFEQLGYIFVIDRKFGEKAQWKLPAGHKKKPDKCTNGDEPDWTPLETAMRELMGETGIKLPLAAFEYAGKWLHWRKDHWKILFAANLSEADRDWTNNHHPENEGEEPKFFIHEEFMELVAQGKFMREHYEKLVEFGLIIPFNRKVA
jgi:8-oxo-dGTP pyrophosphatase MutT (NUDIX family)